MSPYEKRDIYLYIFLLIFLQGQLGSSSWHSERSDSNQQPPTPKADALPICAALRLTIIKQYILINTMAKQAKLILGF